MRDFKILGCAAVLATSILAAPAATFATSSTEDIGSGAKVYKSYKTAQVPAGKISLTLSIIDDPNSDKLVGVVKSDGTHIDSKLHRENNTTDNMERGILNWPSTYHYKLSMLPEQGDPRSNAQFLKIAPTNANLETNVSSSVSYNIGGNVTLGGAEINSGASWSDSASYTQPNYRTDTTINTAKEAAWNTSFVSAMNQGYGPYTRDSLSAPYGNQLFMKKRTFNGAAVENIISGTLLPPLVNNGFDPNIMAVIIANKSETRTPLKFSMDVNSDRYVVKEDLMGLWYGHNVKDDLIRAQYAYGSNQFKWIIDWKEHKLLNGE
ncbi:leukocidin family pore-forming toxin [Bacillus thuringiensis]|uniref:leukocidin family pore-forming toxin n=1 Tax=Bacillus thuringiensis TaxID=1428 RepID=UPI003D0843EB